MPDRDKGQIMMPVTDEQALVQFQIEALQRINDNLRALNSGQNETVKAMKEIRDDLRHIDVRLTRIEAGDTAVAVVELEKEVKALKEEKVRRDGATGVMRWLFPNGQAALTLLGLVILIIIILQANDKL